MNVKKTTLLVILACVALLVPTMAKADMWIDYDLSRARLQYDYDSNQLLVTERSDSRLYMDLVRDGTIIDEAIIDGGTNMDFALDLTVLQASPGVWKATGTLKFTDVNKSANLIEASVRSTNISLVPGAGNMFTLSADLGPISPAQTILVNGGTPWQFQGGTASSFDPGQDGTNKQISIDDPHNWGNGNVFVIKFQVGTSTLEDFFGDDQDQAPGEVKGTIVPAPAAVALGLIGLSIVGWRMRRYA
ncbi:MAG: hypothetical protein J7M21_04175 [Planctomycetes bacterium]|nr:hypothetical protein [Planctomycetota bacterium]